MREKLRGLLQVIRDYIDREFFSPEKKEGPEEVLETRILTEEEQRQLEDALFGDTWEDILEDT